MRCSTRRIQNSVRLSNVDLEAEPSNLSERNSYGYLNTILSQIFVQDKKNSENKIPFVLKSCHSQVS